MKISEFIDLGKRFPDYIHKWVFRVGIILILLVTVFAFCQVGILYAYIECPDDARGQCLNPYYKCPAGQYAECQVDVDNRLCDKGLCDKKYLMPGERIGDEYSFVGQYQNDIISVIVLLTLTINHILWMVKQ